MAEKMTASQALTAQLDAIPAYLRPDFDTYATMKNAAAVVSQAQQAAVIYQMLGIGAAYDQGPAPTAPLHFPQDHLLHLGAGAEWYWVSCHLDATAPDGTPVKIGILLSMERVRLLSLDVQKAAGWSDEECQVAWNAVTAVVATPTSSSITRRDTNVGWLPLGDTVVFPTPGNFRYQVGPDSLTGTPDVLPLHVAVNSLTLSVDLTLSTDMPAESAFFLQGIDGITPGIPGLYYSYPQLTAAGSVTVEGVPYQVKGKGWIDHQLMLGVVPPAPYPPPPLLGYSGWSWCEFNFDNGDAYTSAAFQHGPFRVDPSSFYGFYLRRSGNAWEAEPVTGAIALDRFIPVLNFVMQPTSWTYTGASGTFPTPYPPVDFVVSTAPWTYDGSFQTPDLGIPSEVPVDALLVDRALGSDGLLNYQGVAGRGYCESVDFEPRAAYMFRAWTWLLASLL